MLNLTIRVVVPAGFASIGHELGRVKNFSLDLMLLGTELDLKFCKLFCIKNSVENKLDPVKSLIWVLYFILIKIAHFSWISSEIWRKCCFTAQFGRQIYSFISEVDIQERLREISQSYFMERPHILCHGDNLTSFFHSEGVGVRIPLQVYAINLVRLRVVFGDYGNTRLILV